MVTANKFAVEVIAGMAEKIKGLEVVLERALSDRDDILKALTDLVAAAVPLEMPEKPLKDDGKFISPQEVLRFPVKHYDAVVFGGAIAWARKVMKEE